MADKKQYYALDESGFLGTQNKRSKTEVKRDMEMTVRFIKAKKLGKTTASKSKGNKQ